MGPPAKPGRSAELIERAAWALKMNHPGEAERLAAEVLKAERGNAAAAALLGQALLAQNRAGEAIVPLQKAAKRNDDPALLTLLAIALAANGLHEEAVTQLRRIVVRRPVFPPAFRELASQLHRRGDSAEAIALLQQCLAETPHLVELQMDVASLHLGRNERTLARAAITHALAIAPGRPDLLALLARAMLLDGEYASAADAYRQVLALRPDDSMTRAEFAVCLLEMGDREAGEENLRAATRSQPQMLLRAVHALAAPAHGRFFLRPSDAARFLQDERG